MRISDDIEVRALNGELVEVLYQGEAIGTLMRKPVDRSRRIYTDGTHQYDRLHTAAREMVKRLRGEE